jgi:hypothetical protein
MPKPEFPFMMYPPKGYGNQLEAVKIFDEKDFTQFENQGYRYFTPYGGSRRRRPSRKYKKSAKRVFRKKSRSTRRR